MTPGPRTLLVTGATGFLGRFVVDAALAAGHDVRAVLRPGTEGHPWTGQERVTPVRVDLRQRDRLVEAVSGSDSVLHLAAVKTGDFAARFAGTVVGTENLLAAMDAAGVQRMIHCSSFSVYRSGGVRRGGLLDEGAPLEDRPLLRDEYAQVKLEQERLVRDWATVAGRQLTVVRPGLIYGPGELWHSLLGVELLPGLWLGAGGRTELPMAWVENVADAFMAAVEADPLRPGPFNVVDDRPPTTSEYLGALDAAGVAMPRLVPLGYPLTRLLVHAVDQVNDRLMGGRLKLPSGLAPVPFAARFQPLVFSNERVKAELGWSPRREFPETVPRALALGPPEGGDR